MKSIFRKLLALIFGQPPAVAAKGRVLPASWERYREYVDVHPTAIIDPSSTLHIFAMPSKPRTMIRIGEYSHIFAHFGILREDAQIEVGARCQIGNSHFTCAKEIHVGDDVLMAWGIVVMDNDSHPLDWQQRSNDVRQCYLDYQADSTNFIKNKNWANVPMKPIFIGSRSWIGFNVIILKGVSLAEEAVVGAGSVVTRDVAFKSRVAGNPARPIQKTDVPIIDGQALSQ